MTDRGFHMAAQRVVSLLLGVGFVGTLGGVPVAISAVLLGLVIVAYALWPVSAAEDGAIRYTPIKAVIIPDVLGTLLIAFFFGLPFVAGRSEGMIWHPSVAVMWPMGMIFLSIPVIAWRRAVFALTLGPDRIKVDTGMRRRVFRFDQIEAVVPWQQDLVKGLRGLAPFLVSIGQPGAAGALLVSRPSRGIMLKLRDGTVFAIPGDGLERGIARVLAVCGAQGVDTRAVDRKAWGVPEKAATV